MNNKIETIRQKLIGASNEYYNNDDSILTDEEFDFLKDELRNLNPNDSFLKQIGAEVKEDSHWEKHEHEVPMYSCNKVVNDSEFDKWVNDNNLKNLNLVTSEKLDGMSLSMNYEKGKLISAVTRGDGLIGEDITRNVIKMQNVKQNLSFPYTGSLRGEVIFKAKDFETMNNLREKAGEKQLKNPRNGASGTAKEESGKYSKYLTVLYYNATGDFKTKQEIYDFLESTGLETCPHYFGNCVLTKELYKSYEESKRAKLEYDIDGLIVECDDIGTMKKLGILNENLRGQIAFKFTSMKAKTKILDISWHGGRSGKWTPVAILEAVHIGGVTVQKASLANIANFERLALCKDDNVLISRRNDVIPYVEEVIKRNGNKKFEIPTNCPICNSILENDGTFLTCVNQDCDGNILGNIQKWVKNLDLKGIAKATLETIYDADLIEEPADLYKLTVKDVLGLEGFAQKSAEKVIEILNNKKEITLAEFVAGLNIANFSNSTVELLENNGYDTVEKIQNVKINELIGIHGIGEETAKAIVEGMTKKKTVIKNLLNVGITIKSKERKASMKNGKLAGKTFMFTGKINRINPETDKNFTREDMERFVEENGGSNSPSLNKETNFLVQADPTSTSSKSVKAKKYGTEIISEESFFQMIGM